MGRRNGSYIPKLRRHKASGRAVVTLSGRDVYCGPWGSEEAEKEYQRRVPEWLANDRQVPGRGIQPAFWTILVLSATHRLATSRRWRLGVDRNR